jgi:hypothetical protein
MEEEIEVKDLIVGKKYRVEFDDCCVGGQFVGTLLEVDRDEDRLYSATLDTGGFGTCGGIHFYEVKN